MAKKEAGIKVTLDKSGFTSGLKGAESDVKSSAGRMGKAFSSALSDGVKGGRQALASTFSMIKQGVAGLGLAGGALGFGELVRGAVQGESAFRRLAFSMNVGKREMVSMRDLQREARTAAKAWGQDTEKLGEVMDKVFEETGNRDFTRKSIDTIAAAATGAHEPVETLGTIAGSLNEKFGVTEDQLGDALASVVELTKKGGVGLGELSERFGQVGSVAKKAGLTGEAGFRQMLGFLNLADDGGKNLRRNIQGLQGIFDQLATKQARAKAFALAGLDPEMASGNITKDIGTLLKATGGSRDKLERAGFSGEQLTFLLDMGKKLKASGETFDAALAEASKSSLKFADLRNEAANEMQSTEKRFAVALEQVKEQFSRPEITKAINDLASNLPALAELIGKVASFAVESPVGAAAVGLGGIAAFGFLQNALPSLIMGAFTRGAAAAAPTLTGALASGAPSFASALAGSLGPVALAFGAIAAAVYLAKATEAEEEAERKKAHEKGQEHERGGGGTEGKGGESGSEDLMVRDPATGFWERKTADELGSSYDAIKEAQAAANTQAAEDAGMSLLPDDERDMTMLPEERGYRQPEPKAGGMSEADQRLLADMLATKKLKVEITNIDQLKATLSPNMPRPGYEGRK